MKESIRPISFLKSNTEDVLETVTEKHTPVIITHNGEAKMVIQDVESYYRLKQSLSMLKLAAMGKEQIIAGKTKPAGEVFKSIEKKLGIWW